MLSSGQDVANLNGYAGSQTYFKILVPSGREKLIIRTSGGAGDCDLYTRPDVTPTKTAYSGRSNNRGNDEYIVINNPKAGWWHVMLTGSSNYSGVRLSASFQPAVSHRRPARVPKPVEMPELPRGVLRLTPGQATPELAGLAKSRRYYQVVVPIKAESLTVSTIGGKGDCDVYLTRGSLPDNNNYQYVSNGKGTAEKISVKNPAPGTWYVMVYGYKPYDGVSLAAGIEGGVVPPAQREAFKIVSPAAGAVVRAGATYDLKWTSRILAGRIRVLQSFDGGQTWGDIAPASVADVRKGQIRWTVPYSQFGQGGKTVLIRVIGIDDPRLVVDAGPFELARKGPVRDWPREHGDDGRKGPPIDPVALRLGRYVDRYEPDPVNKPTLLTLGERQLHTLYPRKDKDWMKFVPPTPGKYRVTVGDVLVKTNFEIDSSRAGDGKLARLVKTGVQANGYTVEVDVDRSTAFLLLYAAADDDDKVGPYSVLIQKVVPAGGRPGHRGPQPRKPAIDREDLRLGRYVDKYEPDPVSRPTPLALGERQLHTLYPRKDKDWMKFVPPTPGKYRVTVGDVLVKTNFEIDSSRVGDGKLARLVKTGVQANGYTVDIDVDRSTAFLLLYAAADDDDKVGPYTVLIQKVEPEKPGRGRRLPPGAGGKKRDRDRDD